MHRLIKFRGIDIATGDVVFGDLMQISDCRVFIDAAATSHLVYPDSVAQLIAIDKNGVEVYEGDLVTSRFGSHCFASFRHFGDIIDGSITLVQTRICGGSS